MKTKEYLNFLLDDYNSSNYLQETEDGLTDYLYSLKNKEKLSYKNPAYETAKTTDKIITMNEVLKNINMESQGIGSGAGYIELSNGSFSVDNSMN